MPSSSEVRQQFIEFFVQKCGHTFVPSSSVVPHDDPTLLFANAGMNQFKPYFLGTEKPKFPRVANTQKCIRAGGKHNDLDDVGKDTYHHTFFEMLGNWSFGDYFKKEAIGWAWELLTKVWKLDITRLHVTVFEGDPAAGIPRDDEAADIWKSVGVLDGHIHLGNKKDNFWEMGSTGPCGPCTEIHYDKTPDKSGAKLVNGGSDQCIEIWNNVFIQFNRNEDQSLTPLPAKHVDTGMGFERICAVLNDVPSNYDTDVFTPLFAAIQSATGARPYGGVLEDLTDTAYRVIADHIRTLTFSLTDGAVPGSKGRGAVVRSVLRRASRYGWQVLGMKEPFLHKLVGAVVTQLGDVFPELKRNPEKVREIVYDEEKSFLRTLDKGIKLFNESAFMARVHSFSDAMRIEHPELADKAAVISGRGEVSGSQYPEGLKFDMGVINGTNSLRYIHLPNDPAEMKQFKIDHRVQPAVLAGKIIFDLHTECGLDKGIIQQMAFESDIVLDMVGYEKLWDEHTKISDGKKTKLVVTAIQGTLPATDDSAKFDASEITAKIVGWVADNKVFTEGSLTVGLPVALLLDRTSFYAEQGGQVGDVGTLSTSDGADFEVEDTQRLGETVLHLGSLQQGQLNVGDTVTLRESAFRGIDIMRNHTATHLLNLGLRTVLGSHVEQKGSLVDDTRTRFDFSHDKPVSADEIRQIEAFVNTRIQRELPVTAVTLPLSVAKEIPGVRAMFGEKYPDPVRVVLVGPESPEKASHDDSVEFCGGTHVSNTATIGYFKIQNQESVAKGVRRVTAVTGRTATELLSKLTGTVDELTGKFLCKPEELPARIDALQDELKKLKAQVAKNQAAELGNVVDKLLAEATDINGVKVIIGQLPGVPMEAVRSQIDRIRQKHPSSFIVFGWAEEDGKVPVVVALSKDLTAKGLKAGDLVKPIAAIVGGSGGGKPDIAQAGGKDATQLPAALDKARALAVEKL